MGQSIARDFQRFETRILLRHRDAHGAPVAKCNFDRQDSRTRLLLNLHPPLGCGHDAQFSEQEPSADHGMPRERQLARGRENSQPRERAIIRGPLDEDGFRQIHLARDSLHLWARQIVAIGDYCEGIPREWLCGENIELIQAPLQMGLRAGNKYSLHAFQFCHRSAILHISRVPHFRFERDNLAYRGRRPSLDGFRCNVRAKVFLPWRKLRQGCASSFPLSWFPHKRAASLRFRMSARAPIQYRRETISRRPYFHGVPRAIPAAWSFSWSHNAQWPFPSVRDAAQGPRARNDARRIPSRAYAAVRPAACHARPSLRRAAVR